MAGSAAVRVRGIYATAISVRARRAGLAIADPSAILRERLEGPFGVPPADVAVRDTDDRIGVEITGTGDGVRELGADLSAISTDTLRWPAAHPRAAVFAVEVAEEGESGAIVQTGAGTAFLPYGNVEGYVSAGDRLLAQVIDPEPPWSIHRRPVLADGIRAGQGPVTLERGVDATIARATDDEVARTIERIGIAPPPDWGYILRDAAGSIEPGQLEAILEAAVSEAEQIEAEIQHAGDDDVDPIVAPRETVWIRFGREGRFTLDEDRAEAVPTFDGHHRMKAVGEVAGRAVDLLEAYGVDGKSFDPATVFGVFGPKEGDRLELQHGKPTGETIDLGRGRVTDVGADGAVIVEREIAGSGRYDAIGTERSPGDIAETTLVEGRWWYPTIYRSEAGTYKGTYVNVGTPMEIEPDGVRYVDLYVDVIRQPDGTVEMVDDDELADARERGDVSDALARRARNVAEAVVDGF